MIFELNGEEHKCQAPTGDQVGYIWATERRQVGWRRVSAERMVRDELEGQEQMIGRLVGHSKDTGYYQIGIKNFSVF